jgi:hypothetical protein
MTPPAPPQRPVMKVSLSLILLVIGAGLFVLAAFASGGDTVGTVPAWSWAFGGFAAWILSGAVP